jgi:hypothetical protein
MATDGGAPSDKKRAAGKTGPAPEMNPFSLKRYSPGTRKIASFGLILFVLGLLVTALWAPHYWPLSVLCSGSFMAIGWAIGFLFGVPRTNSSDKTTNTNLEQISDWLTKVLVGVGLTQLQKIPVQLGTLATYIAKDYGASGSSVFALSMVLYFSAIGFLTGYLLTRLALQPAFEAQDNGGNVQVNAGTAQVNVDRTTTPDDNKDAPQ